MNFKSQKMVSYPVMEQFYTIQGEGGNSGKAAYFIRLAGCDVGCTWCDVKESWNAADHPTVSVESLVENCKHYNAQNVVITGGEPTLYNLEALTNALHLGGTKTWIETSGTNELTGTWDWICFSPKKFKAPVDSIYQQCHELKVVAYNKHDLTWALQHAEKVNPNCQLFIQPEWSKREIMEPLLIEFVKQNPQWRLSLQTHKYLQIP